MIATYSIAGGLLGVAGYLGTKLSKKAASKVTMYSGKKYVEGQVSKADKKALESIKNCRFCNERDFALLKDLQKQYHLEEVYTSTSSYPYNYEMAAFRHTLQNRKNAALFVNGIAVSKVYITAESSDRYQLGGIFTRKQYRGQGCGWRVLSFFIYAIWQIQHKKKIFQLFVKKNNKAACALYKKIGFMAKDETSYFYY